MSLAAVLSPYLPFNGLTGLGLNDGALYIGIDGQDPETNPQACYWDAAGTIAAFQPVQILGGYPMRAGTPTRLYTAATYSIRVRDATGSQVFYEAHAVPAPNVSAGVFVSRAAAAAAVIPPSVQVTGLQLLGYAQAGDGGEATYRYSPVQAAGDGRFQSTDGAWWEISSIDLTPQMFGALASNSAADRATNLTAFQAAMNVLAVRGGGRLFVPPGSYWVSCSAAISVPENVTISGDRGASIIKPYVPECPPGATTAVFWPGVGRPLPVAAGSCWGVVGAGVQARNVHIHDLDIVCDYAGPKLTTQIVYGISYFHMVDSSVVGCYMTGLPNTGVHIFGGYNTEVRDNIIEECGWLGITVSSCNGLHVTGFVATNSEAKTSKGAIVTGNICRDNRDEGIQFANFGGIVVADNVCIGNGDRGIEGDSEFALPFTSGTLGYPIPNDAIVANNYINGRGSHQTACLQGITIFCGNEGHITIQNNTVLNVAGFFGIAVGQTDGATIRILDNTVQNIVLPLNFHAIFAEGDYVDVCRNRVINPSVTASTNSSGVLVKARKSARILDNDIGSGLPTPLVAQAEAVGGTASTDLITIRGNTVHGALYSAIEVYLTANGACSLIDVSDNKAFGINSTATTDRGFLSFKGSGGAVLTVARAIIEGNSCAYAAATLYPIMSDAMPAASINDAYVRHNAFGNPTVPFGTRCIESPAFVVNLYETDNGIPGQRIASGTAAPVAGTWGQGDIVVNASPGAGTNIGWVCTVSGTPGTWKSYGAIAP